MEKELPEFEPTVENVLTRLKVNRTVCHQIE